MLNFDSQGIHLLNLDLPRYNKTLDRVMGQIVREAAREWLRTILEKNIPVETGMAKAALVPVGRFLNRVGGLDISPTRQPYKSKLEGGTVSIAFGIAKSSFVLDDDKSTPLSFVYNFEWSTSVLHYWLQQFYKQGTPGEAHLPDAEEAFHAYVAEAIERRIPHYADFILEG